MSIQCACGRFLANTRYWVTVSGFDAHLSDVRGDCSRCGPDVQASRTGDDTWWWSWDAWTPGIDELADHLLKRLFDEPLEAP